MSDTGGKVIQTIESRDDDVEFTCPFCMGAVIYRENVVGDGRPGLLHEVPICASFEAMPPDEYLEKVDAVLFGSS